jgi:site-specific DNA-methyltransferase (adenine-specific)
MRYTIHHGDCLDVLKTLADCSVDAIVTDPPYGLGKEPDPVKVMAAWVSQGYFEVEGSGFMGKKWDAFVPQPIIWKEVFRVLKPGGHLLAFAGTRTQDWMAMSLRFAGFEIRDMIAWVYGSGFPKSLDVSKAIDKGSGENRDRQLKFTAWMRSTGITADQINEATQSSMASHYLTDKSQPAIATADLFDRLRPFLPDVPEEIERLVCERTGIEWTAYKQREVVGKGSGAISTRKDLRVDNGTVWGAKSSEFDLTAPATEAAKQWEGWGTALKPALEPITLARKPLKTSCVNVLAVVESSLRNQGVKGDIKWKKENASGAGKKKLKASLDSTRHLEPSAVYAKSAGETETGSEERQTRKSLEKPMPIGEQKTGSTTGVTQNPSAKNCEIKSYPLTVESANAAERPNQFSLQSTISTAEGPSTGNLFTEKFTSNSKETDTLRDTESFVGIATGLTGSMASVRIVRDLEGRFLWPSGLPEFVPGSQLTVAANVLEHGTGGLNIGACRVATENGEPAWHYPKGPGGNVGQEIFSGLNSIRTEYTAPASGRFPANLLHDNSEEVLALLGEAARFYYSPKASRDDRDEGCGAFELTEAGIKNDSGRGFSESDPMAAVMRRNPHPTVKPTDLMRYLCRLITPPNGIVLDPFMGSGSTGKAAMAEGFRFIGIEREAEYIEIARARISAEADKPRQLSLF